MTGRWVIGLCVAALAGCGPPSVDAGSPQVAEARRGAVPRVQAVLAPAVAAGSTHGSTSSDGCESGQDTNKVQDDFLFRCGYGEALVVGLDAATTEDAVALAEGMLRAGCPGASPAVDLAGDLKGVAAVREGRDGAIVRYLSCGEIKVEARVMRSGTGRRAEDLSWWPYSVSPDGRLDGPGALRAAADDGRLFVLAVQALTDYYVEPRPSS